MSDVLVLIIILIIAATIIACLYHASECNGIKPILISISIGIIAIILVVSYYFNFSESGKRNAKSIKSDLGGGITRVVTVYDIEGDVIAEYKGKFDIEYDSDRILFDDENGYRHIIYYHTGNVIIDEISE
jgi:hypothetical protein